MALHLTELQAAVFLAMAMLDMTVLVIALLPVVLLAGKVFCQLYAGNSTAGKRATQPFQAQTIQSTNPLSSTRAMAHS